MKTAAVDLQVLALFSFLMHASQFGALSRHKGFQWPESYEARWPPKSRL